ncbi:MAG: AAA family ATPase, partial [Oscillospiraceae bacterium]
DPLEQQRRQAARGIETAISNLDFELAARLRDVERQLSAELLERQRNATQSEASEEIAVTAQDIAQVLSRATGIEVTALSGEESERLLGLEEALSAQVIGQQEAVSAVVRAVRRGRVGLSDPERPIGSFLFLGPTGVGKTELCRALSRTLFGAASEMIRLDMSEYMEKQSVSRLIGSPPGYIGYDDGGQLTEKVRRKPYSVVLFDEIEKAHPEVLHILLQLLEDGRLTDAHGRTCSFKNAVIIMTSNIGARHITDCKALGFTGGSTPGSEEIRIKKDVLFELKKIIKPELLNRLDEILVFRRLNGADMIQIAARMLGAVKERMAALGIRVEFARETVEMVAKAGFDPDYGARPLRRMIQTKIEDLLAQELLGGRIAQGDQIECVLCDGNLAVRRTVDNHV